MKINTGGSKQIKFPVLNDVEYVSLFKNRNSVLEVDGKDIEGLTWRQFQLYLGKFLQPSVYNFVLKFKKSNEQHTGKIRATIMGVSKTEPENNSSVINELKTLKDQLSKAEKSGGVSYDMLLASTKAGHAAQIDYLNQKIQDKEEKIKELKEELNELDQDLDDCLKESSKNSSIGQYLAIGEKILSMKFGSPAKVSLKESDPTDIPEQILIVLGVIDWQKIDAENISRIANNIQQYLSAIPKEYFKGV
jgi:cell division protein FtsB